MSLDVDSRIPVASFEEFQDHSPRGVTFGEILLAVKARLVTELDLKDGTFRDRVVIVSDRKIDPKAIAETHIRIRPMTGKGQDNPGAGRLAAFKTRVIAVDLIIRNAADQASSDEVALCDHEVGLFVVEEKILNLLDLHTPTHQDRALVVQPMMKVAVEDTNRPEPGDGFVTTTLHFECAFVPLYQLRRT